MIYRGYGFLPRMAVISVAFGLVAAYVPTCNKREYKKLYRTASEEAALRFGDKCFPLSSSEKAEWYESM